MRVTRAGADKISSRISLSRRDFLRDVIGASLYPCFPHVAKAATTVHSYLRKAVVITFGGGARDDETFGPDGLENIPHLLNELMPHATFFTRVVNEGILGHYVATASIACGAYEKFNNFAASPPESPTVFEYFRKGLSRPSADTWVVAPSNGFNRIGQSSNSLYGPGYGAGVILPKRLLHAALPSGSAREYENLLRDNYETPFYAPSIAGNDIDQHVLAEMLKLSFADFVQHARTLTSPDELSVYLAKRLMQQFSPSLLWLTLHDMDIAHTGAYSLYLDGIQRSDRLCAEVWRTIQSDPEYANKTTMFILPDFGRDGDAASGGNGFQHHRTGDAISRTTWMMVLGPGIRENVYVNRPVKSTDLVPTLGKLFGFPTPYARGNVLYEIA
jgi:hypothetical protein